MSSPYPGPRAALRSMHRILFLMLLAGATAMAAPRPGSGADEPKTLWSVPLDGMQARLVTEPSQDPTLDRTYNFSIVFHESGLDTSLGIQHVTRSIHFSVTAVSVQINDAKGLSAELLPATDQPTPPGWDLVLPPNGNIDFPIGHGGSSPHQSPGVTPKGKLFHLDSGNEWSLLPDRGPYHIVVTLSITQDPSPDIKGAKAWHGALSLPAINLPVE